MDYQGDSPADAGKQESPLGKGCGQKTKISPLGVRPHLQFVIKLNALLIRTYLWRIRNRTYG